MIAIMTNLIVDFPTQQRTVSRKSKRTFEQSLAQAAPSAPSSASAVQFASEVTIRYYEHAIDAGADASDLYYTKEDYKSFKSQHKQDVRQMIKIIESQDNEAFQKSVITGIENVLSRDLIKKTMARRADCVRAVLNEQDLQHDYYDADRLAAASMQYSRAAVQKSVKIGLMQSYV